MVGFDWVDDESKPERRPTKHMPTTAQWTNIFNPAYSYYIYYCYANLYTLNKVKKLFLFMHSPEIEKNEVIYQLCDLLLLCFFPFFFLERGGGLGLYAVPLAVDGRF